MTNEQIQAIVSEELTRASEQIKIQLQIANTIIMNKLVTIGKEEDKVTPKI
jgi:trehalose/maltose hydrolase-like predicted phosphorylase